MTGMRGLLLKALPSIDRAAARCWLMAGDRPKLLCFMFHGLYRPGLDLDRSPVLPIQLLRLDRFRVFVARLLDLGYRIVGPDIIARELDPRGKYAALSFDDGYYNNVLALPVLEEFDVPAIFSIATESVEQAKAFWWDAAHRQGAPLADIAELKRLSVTAIEAKLAAQGTVDWLMPAGDIDRPFTPAELKDFSSHRLVHLGNHTRGHVRLSQLPRDAAEREIRGCQDALRRMTGRSPTVIAYPNGDYHDETIALARDCGIEVGLTVEPRANSLPINGKAMALGRFGVRDDDDNAARLDIIRAEFALSRRISAIARGAQ